MTPGMQRVRQVVNYLRAGKYTSVGSYPTFFVCSDGGALSHEGARENIWQVLRSTRDDLADGWNVEWLDVNWEDPELYCDHTGERIESAYAEPEETADATT